MIVKIKDKDGTLHNVNQIASNISNVFDPLSEMAMSGIAVQQAIEAAINKLLNPTIEYIGWKNMEFFNSIPVGSAYTVSLAPATDLKRSEDNTYWLDSFISTTPNSNGVYTVDSLETMNNLLDADPTANIMSLDMKNYRALYPNVVLTLIKLDESNNFAVYNQTANTFIGGLTSTDKLNPWSSTSVDKFKFVAPWSGFSTAEEYLKRFANSIGFENGNECDSIFRLLVNGSETSGLRLALGQRNLETDVIKTQDKFASVTGTGSWTAWVIYVWEKTEIPAFVKDKLGL